MYRFFAPSLSALLAACTTVTVADPPGDEGAAATSHAPAPDGTPALSGCPFGRCTITKAPGQHCAHDAECSSGRCSCLGEPLAPCVCAPAHGGNTLP